MTNLELAKTFTLIANLLKIKGEVIYKVLAYEKAADSLTNLGRDVNGVWQEGKLEDIPGVGKAIAEKIDELLRTGKLEFLEKLKKEIPESLAALMEVPDLGPKKIKLFYDQLGIKSVEELKAAAEADKLRGLEGMGEKSEQKILAGIQALSTRSGRVRLGDALPFAEEQMALLKKVKGVKKVETAGSLRRRRETIGDIDLLVAAEDAAAVMEAFTGQQAVSRVLSKGDIKSSVEFHNGMRAQVWVHPPEEFGTALQYATGSKDHNVRTRALALTMGLSLTQQAIINEKDGGETRYATEEEVYKAIGLAYVPPELREDRGEVQAAQDGKLPKLIELKDIKMDLHMHSTWSDGKASIMEMAENAIAKGYKALAITDHSQSLGIANGLTVERLMEAKKEVEKARKELGDRIVLLHGTEMEIKADGTLDYPDDVLAELDIVIASLHVSMRQPRAQVTERMLNAIHNPHVDIIGHPTNRLILERDGADLDMDAIFAAAAETDTALEINANPQRLDLTDVHARRAIEMGIKLTINTDAHHPSHMDFMTFGVATARRGWVQAKHVLNTWPPDKVVKWLKERK
jgi:DNA polymerase (family 10)